MKSDKNTNVKKKERRGMKGAIKGERERDIMSGYKAYTHS